MCIRLLRMIFATPTFTDSTRVVVIHARAWSSFFQKSECPSKYQPCVTCDFETHQPNHIICDAMQCNAIEELDHRTTSIEKYRDRERDWKSRRKLSHRIVIKIFEIDLISCLLGQDGASQKEFPLFLFTFSIYMYFSEIKSDFGISRVRVIFIHPCLNISHLMITYISVWNTFCGRWDATFHIFFVVLVVVGVVAFILSSETKITLWDFILLNVILFLLHSFQVKCEPIWTQNNNNTTHLDRSVQMSKYITPYAIALAATTHIYSFSLFFSSWD